MTDKQMQTGSQEQIIIDGVDVSGCKNVCNTAFGKVGCKYAPMKIYCSDNPNCYFKQLARKTQECEELKKQLEFVRTHRTVIDAEKDRYRKALEEIEQELKEDIYCESQECGCDDFEECLRCTKDLILDIISRAKDC